MSCSARAQGGESFEALARTIPGRRHGANGGDLGMLTRTQLPDELGGAIFSMDEGEIDGPVKTDFGFHVVRLDESSRTARCRWTRFVASC